MLRIHKAIQSRAYPNACRLAAELEVSSKSVHRDLEFMRDRLQLPLEFDRRRLGYYYTEEVNAFPTLKMTEGEFVALLVAEKALQQYRGTSFEKPLLSAIRKMQESLPETISVNLDEVGRAISFRTRAEPVLDLEIFDILAKAVAGHQQLELTYRKAGQAKSEQRRIDPYHLANINGEWFLFAYDYLRHDIRTFVPARIKAARPTGRTFHPSRRFSVEQRLRGSFGVHSGQGEFEVVIRFEPAAADYILEKKWHDSQTMRKLRNGGVELRLRLSSLEEVERWVLSWGGQAAVLRPAALATSVKRAAQRILRTH
jgi:predicted DNA-binding transcriptional regulator YafY